MDLRVYAASQKRRRTAWLTTIPEHEHIVEVWNEGTITATQIRRWLLEDCGYDPAVVTTSTAIAYYLNRYHPR